MSCSEGRTAVFLSPLEWLAREEFLARIEKHFLDSTSSLLFSIMDEDAAEDQVTVETPVFVESDTWPELERSA